MILPVSPRTRLFAVPRPPAGVTGRTNEATHVGTRSLIDDGRLDQLAVISTRVLLVIVAYLAVTCLMGIIAETTGSRILRRLVRTTTPRFLTTLLIGIVATASPAGAQADGTHADHPAMVPATTPTAVVMKADEPPIMTVTTSMTMQVEESETDRRPEASADDDRPGPSDQIPETSQTSGSTHVVVPGEHFWSIAESVLIGSGITDPDDMTIARYWSELVDANRDGLVQPGNADLIVPGQTLIVPPPG